MNSYTRTPVNVVWYDALLALALGLLVFASDQAINAVFSMSVTAVYIAYAIPIVVRFTGGNKFQPGPFSLGRYVRFLSSSSPYYCSDQPFMDQSLPIAIISVTFMLFLGIVFLFPGTPTTNATEMNYSIVVIGGVLVLSVLWYYFPKYGGVHWFKGPISNIDTVVEHSDSSVTPSNDEMDKKDSVEEVK